MHPPANRMGMSPATRCRAKWFKGADETGRSKRMLTKTTKMPGLPKTVTNRDNPVTSKKKRRTSPARGNYRPFQKLHHPSESMEPQDYRFLPGCFSRIESPASKAYLTEGTSFAFLRSSQAPSCVVPSGLLGAPGR